MNASARLLLAWLVLQPLLAAAPTNSIPNEPVFHDKPLSYWLDGLAKWDARAADASKAVKSLGASSAQFILQYTALRNDGTTNQPDTGRAVARAFRLLDQGKYNRKLDRSLRDGFKDTNPQVRLNAIAGVPPDEKYLKELEKLGQDPVPEVRRAATNAVTHLTRYNDWAKRQQAEPSKPAPPAKTSKSSQGKVPSRK